MKTGAKSDIDGFDRQILQALAENARITNNQLAEHVGLSSTACARRIVALERDGYLVGYQAILDIARFGLTATIMVRITLDSQSEDALGAFEHAVLKCPSVSRCFLMSGSDDYILTVNARDIEDFEHIHKTQLSRLPRVARLHSSFAIREVVNRRNPPVVFEAEKPAPRRAPRRR